MLPMIYTSEIEQIQQLYLERGKNQREKKRERDGQTENKAEGKDGERCKYLYSHALPLFPLNNTDHYHLKVLGSEMRVSTKFSKFSFHFI